MSQWYDKVRKHWIAKFWFQSEPYRKGGFKTKTAAREWEKEKRAELERPIPSESLRNVVNKYLLHCAATFQPNTCRAKASYFKRFDAYLLKNHPEITPEDPVESIPKLVLTQYFDQVAIDEGRKNANRHLKDFNAMFNWAVGNDLIGRNPVKKIPKKGEDQYRKYVPPTEDVNRVLLVADPDEQDILTAIYKAGARLSEVIRLTWDDINLDLGTICLWTRKRKGGGYESRTLKMPLQLMNVMERRHKTRDKRSPWVFCQPDGEPWRKDQKWIREMMSRVCEKAEVKPFTFHALRHRIAATLEDSGEATIGMMQGFLGHKRKATTEDYLKTLDRGALDLAGIIDFQDAKAAQKEEEKASK